MGAVAATAQRGRGARGGLVARSALRLLALLGFACVAVVLCSTSANADNGDASGHAAAPAPKPGLVPGLLKTANSVLRPVVAPVTGKGAHAATAPASSPAHPAAPTHQAPSPASTAAPSTPAASPILAAAATEPSRSSGTPEVADSAPLPLHDALTPVVDVATHAVTDTLTSLSHGTSSIPALGLATTLLRTVGTATTQVATSVGSLTTRVDTGMVSVVAVTGSLLTPTARGSQPPAAGSSSSTGTGTSTAPTNVAATSSVAVLGVLGVPTPGHLSSLTGSQPGALSAPTQQAGAASTASTVPVLVAAPAAPAFGAIGTALGSVPGAPVGGSSGLHEQTEAPRGLDFRAVMAVGRACIAAVRPLPGTPLVDPGFSPD